MSIYIKHFLSFLLIFGLAVTEGAVFSQSTTPQYYQVAYTNTNNEVSTARTALNPYSKPVLPLVTPAATFVAYRSLDEVFSAQVHFVFTWRKQEFQKIDATFAQQCFLSKRSTTSNHYTNLYIA